MASSGVSLAFAESQTRLKHWACPYLLQACAQHRMGTHCLQGGFMKRRAVVVQEALLLRAPCVWHVGWIIMARKKKNNPKVKLRKYASSLIFQSINIKHTVGASRLVQWLRAHLPVQGSGKASRAAGQRACVHRIREGPTCRGATSLCAPHPGRPHVPPGNEPVCTASGKTPRAAERQSRVHRSC